MKEVLLVLFLLSCVLSQSDDDFYQWIKQYNKFYRDETEYSYRLEIYKQSKQKIKELQLKFPNVSFALNKFADLTTEEFQKFHIKPQKKRLWWTYCFSKEYVNTTRPI